MLIFNTSKNNAGDRNRTGTGGKSRRILSPVRLPVPPRRHPLYKARLLASRMDRGGFEPPKQVAADLQSVPFGHSGICPFRANALTRTYISTSLLKMQAFFLIM